MTRPVTIAVDAMGGDHGPAVVASAVRDFLDRAHSVHLTLVGDESAVAAALHSQGLQTGERIHIHHASQRVEMDEPPSQALRGKKDSSMRVAINLVRDGAADACVSAGNTGALVATARYVLKTLPGVSRPAICAALPTLQGHCHMLDLGANVDSSASHLFEFAVMGAVLAAAVDGIERPRIGLLNIGAEEIKGNEVVKEAAQLLAAGPFNYIGYVEGDGIFKGAADVVVCDGFVGNVALKTSEGVAKMIAHYLRTAFTGSLPGRIAGLVSRPVLRNFRDRIDPRRYNGASLLGLSGIVVKSHGGADASAFANALETACIEVEKAVPSRIGAQIEQALAQRQAS